MNLRINTRRALRTLTLPVATLVGLGACGDDSSPNNTPDSLGDTVTDTTPADAADTLAPDTSGPDDTAGDTTTPDTEADSIAPDTTDTATDSTSADTADTADTSADTMEDTSPGDVVTPPSSKIALVAWNGLSTNSPARGSINVTTSTGSAFGPFVTWKNGTPEAPVAFGSTANLIGDIDGDGLADLVAWNGLSTNSPARGSINVFLSTGSAFSDFSTWKSGTDQAPVVFGSTASLIGDIDGDGDDDLVAWNGLSTNSPARGSINVMLSSGSAFGDAITWKTGTDQAPVVFGSTANLIGDVDGDGDDDLVAWSGLSLNSPARGSISVFLSNGSGFGDATAWFTGTNENPTLFGSTANLIADVNGDGRADLIAWNGLSTNSPARGSISVFVSTGTGFSPASTWFTGTNESPTLFGTTANLAGAAAE